MHRLHTVPTINDSGFQWCMLFVNVCMCEPWHIVTGHGATQRLGLEPLVPLSADSADSVILTHSLPGCHQSEHMLS
jgi:hypothetical protein